jgi:hypothetical protein
VLSNCSLSHVQCSVAVFRVFMLSHLLYPPETTDRTYLRYCPDQGVWIHLRCF